MRSPALLLLLLALAGCAGLTGPREDFTVYALDPPAQRGDGPVLDWQLLIDQPHTSDLLGGFRVVVAPGGAERQVYKGARWSERAPSLVQGVWVRAFEADGRLPGAARAGTGVRADLLLATDLTDFQARYRDGVPVVEVEVHARLVDPRDRRIVAREVFRAEAPADGVEVAAVVAGFQSALAQATTELVGWTLVEGDRYLDGRRTAAGARAGADGDASEPD
jgi:cholesterol transport system auxiliary component